MSCHRTGTPPGCPLAVPIVLLVCTLLAPSTNANPLDAFGFGGRAIGMGGAYTSLADDSSANYYNPAGLAQGEDLRFDLGYLYAAPNLDFDDQSANVDAVRGLQGGVVMPGEVLGVRFGAGIGLFVLDERVTRVRSLPQQQPRFVLYDNRVQRLFIAANLAVEIYDHLFVGGGVTFFSDSFVDLDVSGRVSLIESERTELQAGVGGDLRSARYATVGMLYAPDAPWSVGLVFRDEFFLRLELDTAVRGQILVDNDPENPIVIVEDGSFLLNSVNANLFTPRQLVLGGSYSVGPMTFAADVGWYQWSRFPAPTSRVDIELDLEGLDFSVPPTDPVEEPNFSDLIVPRFGIEGRAFTGNVVDVDIRGGYFFEGSPAPDQPGRTNYADAAKHGLSLGLGLSFHDFSEVFPKPLVVDISALYVIMANRTFLKEDPADLIGDYSIDGHVLGISTMLGVLF